MTGCQHTIHRSGNPNKKTGNSKNVAINTAINLIKPRTFVAGDVTFAACFDKERYLHKTGYSSPNFYQGQKQIREKRQNLLNHIYNEFIRTFTKSFGNLSSCF